MAIKTDHLRHDWPRLIASQPSDVPVKVSSEDAARRRERLHKLIDILIGSCREDEDPIDFALRRQSERERFVQACNSGPLPPSEGRWAVLQELLGGGNKDVTP